MSDLRFAIIGCGYVADFYMQTVQSHPEASVIRAYDIEQSHAERFTRYWNIPSVSSEEDFFKDLDVDAILNLTNPDSHFDVSKMCLNAGYSVYSEKPLAMKYEEIIALRDLASEKKLALASAPCNHLSEAVAAMRGALAQGNIGNPLLAYAEMDDGLIAKSPYKSWINPSGAPWPYEDEFEVGCTLEHAGYYLTWLIALFGSISEVHAFSSLCYPGKPVLHAPEAPDFSVACLKFENGLTARLTCGVVAPRDHQFKIFGDEGQMTAEDCWFYDTPVSFKRWIRIRRRFMLTPWATKVKVEKSPIALPKSGAAEMDFIRGPIEMMNAVNEKRPSHVATDFCVHFNEVSLAIHESKTRQEVYHVKTRCTSFKPVDISDDDSTKALSFFERKILPMLGRL